MRPNKQIPKQPHLALLRGSLTVLRRKCGKPNCRCASGKPHPSPALSVSRGGKTFILTLPKHVVPPVRKALQRYRLAQARLERQAAQSLESLAKFVRRSRNLHRRKP